MLIAGEHPRHLTDHADCTEGMSALCDHCSACIEDDVRSAGDERIITEALIYARVLDREDILATDDRMIAKAFRTRRLARVDTTLRLEPLTRLIDEGHQRDRRLTDERG